MKFNYFSVLLQLILTISRANKGSFGSILTIPDGFNCSIII